MFRLHKIRHGLFDDSTAVDIDGHVMTIPRSHDSNYAFLNWGVWCLMGLSLCQAGWAYYGGYLVHKTGGKEVDQ